MSLGCYGGLSKDLTELGVVVGSWKLSLSLRKHTSQR